MTTLWSFLLVLSGLIFFHELGHFTVARLFGIRVLKFSIGFGPRLWGFVRNGTDYCISAIPLGGFVKMLGELPNEEVPPEERHLSFSHRPVYQRALVVAAGPFANFLLAQIIFFFILLIYGNPILLPEIGSVRPDSPAARAGLQKGDVFVAVDGMEVKSWEDVSKYIKSSHKEKLHLRIKRGDKILDVYVTPEISTVKNIFGEEVKVPLIGVTASGKIKIEKVNPIRAFVMSFQRTWQVTKLTWEGFVKIIERVVPLSTLGGPIMIAQMAGQEAQQGLLNLFYFMAVLSVNLGILNLLPIPVLDGGHLFFFAIEAIKGSPLSQRQMQLAQQIGLLILGSLMLLVFYNDIARLLGLIPAVPKP
ncbi:MAG: RIP metalloprotease RseP [Thermodesulfobacteria bacterium]|nr:RIP metalloprotease RseP [Thermodesulfobacteriota bacterium]